MRQLFHIRSEVENHAPGMQALIEAGENHCCYALLNRDMATLHEFAYYTGEQPGEDIIASVLKTHFPVEVHEQQPAILYNFLKSTLVPSSLYRSEEAASYLAAVYGDANDSHILADNLLEWDLYNVYAVPASAHELLNRRFTSGQYRHYYSLLLNNNTPPGADQVNIDIRQNGFTVVLLQKGKLQLVQGFEYETAADMLYYLLKICRQFSLSQQDLRLQLSGFIEKESALYKELYKYFIHIEMASIPPGIKLSDAFGGYPPHYFLSVCRQATCVL